MKILVNLRLVSLPMLAALVLSGGCAPPALFENEYGSIVAAIDSEAEIPTGMRRTTSGWEDSSLWHVSTDLQSRSIHAWMTHQRRREPGWARRVFERIRGTPPLMIAVIQISAIAAIVHLSRQSWRGQS
jgi:hypothetical protein